MFKSKTPQGEYYGHLPSAGTEEGLHAAGIYIDVVVGLKSHIASLKRMNSLLTGIAALLAMTVLVMQPLKEREPYFYEVDTSTGSVGISSRTAQRLTVNDANIAYFLRVWTARLITINASTLKEGLPGAYRWTRGSAQTELDIWTDKVDQTAKRMGEKPDLTRELLGQPTVSFNESKTVAFIDFVWLEKVKGVETDRRRKLLTVEFGLTSNADAAEKRTEIDPDNPIGLLITHFTINETRTQ